jgi:hemoglobin/transferrin/lactoferrin receptor protein
MTVETRIVVLHTRRLSLAAALLACTASVAFASQALELRLVEPATGRPVTGAEVSIVGRSGSVKTDAAGRVSLTPEPKPPFVLLIVLAGGRVARPVHVEKIESPLVVTVEPAVAEELTVAGVAPSIEAPPAAGMTMLAGRDVQLRGSANLMQAIENVPGVGQVSEGQAAVPAVRGLARGRTLILIDGSRVTSERRVGPSATYMDPAIVDGVDIARGPGSVAYGSDALGGVISIRTRRPPHTGLQASGAATIGGGIPDRRVEGSVAKGFGSGGLLFAAHVRDVDDYHGPEGAVLNSGWGDSGFLVRGERRAGTGLLSASWQSDFGRDIERPRNNSSQVRFSYPFDNSHRFNASYDRTNVGGLDALQFSGFLGANAQRTDQDRLPTSTRPRDIVRADIEARDFQVRVTGDKLLNRAKLEFGVDVNGRYGLEAHDVIVQYGLDGAVTSESDTLSIESARRTDTGLFAQVESPIAASVTVKGGLRANYVRTVNRGGFFGDRTVSNGAAAGFASLAWVPAANVTVVGQVSRGFRDPTLSDRFFRGPSGRGFITGNPDLEPETSLQFDGGVRYATGRLRVAGYVYHYRIHKLVERFSTDTDFFFFRNRGRARIRGVEAESQIDAGRGVVVELAAQIGRGRALDDGTPLDDVSADSVSIVVRKSFRSRVMAFARIAAYDADDRPGPSEIAAPGHANLDVGGSWTISPRVELRGAVRNLLDEAYYASPDPRFVLAPGINGFVTLAVRY